MKCLAPLKGIEENYSPGWTVTGNLRNLDFPGPDGACRRLERKSQCSCVGAYSTDVNIN
jgi:hypothetical protein